MLLENNPYPSDVRVRREAESLASAGHRVVVAAPRAPGQPRRETIAGVEVRRFAAPDGSGGVRSLLAEYLAAATALHAAAVRELARGATVLHLHNPPDILFPAGLLARALGRKVVFDHHDLAPELVQVKFGSARWARLAQLAERATFAVAHQVLATNESHAEVACTRGGKRRDEVAIVRNGPVAAHLVREPAARDGALRDPHLVYVGAVSDQDGVEALAELLARLRDDHGLAARLTVVGDGDGRPAVERAAEAAGVRAQVEFTGWLAMDDVPARIATADICVDPAPSTPLNERSTMVKVAEYLAQGKPVVAFGLAETARTVGDAALLARPGDVGDLAGLVARLAQHPEERLALSHRAVARAPALVWERSERALLEVYERL